MFGKLIMSAFPKRSRPGNSAAANLSSLHTFYNELDKEGVIFCFNGPTSQSVVEGVGEAIRQRMDLEAVDMNTVRRVFAIFVEQIQNVVNYSSERKPVRPGDPKGVSYGVIVIGREDGKYYVMCGNKVESDKGRRLAEKIRRIQPMNKAELKEYYKAQRRNGPGSDSLGAGLGLIEMARRATEPLKFSITALNERESFFTIKATS